MRRVAVVVILLATLVGVLAPPTWWFLPRGLLQARFGDVDAMFDEIRAPFQVHAQDSDVRGFVDIVPGSIDEAVIRDWVESVRRTSASGWRYSIVSWIPKYSIDGEAFNLKILERGYLVFNSVDGAWPDGQFMAPIDTESAEYAALAAMIEELCPVDDE